MGRLAGRGALLAVLVAGALLAGCQTMGGGEGQAGDVDLLGPLQLAKDTRLDDAAKAICVRGTDALIDDGIRADARVWEGRVVAVMEPSRAQAAQAAQAVFAGQGLTHAGAWVGRTEKGRDCAAVVGSRQLVTVTRLPQAYRSEPTADSVVELVLLPQQRGTLYVMGADGFVDRLPLEEHERAQQRKLPFRKEGRQVMEILIDSVGPDGAPEGNVEVAVLWPYLRGAIGAAPPVPRVLFPDDGHDDHALSLRAETLVQRLRNELLLDPLRISPPLVDVASRRLGSVQQQAALGHQLAGQSPQDALLEAYPDAPHAAFVRLSEVQGRGGSLQDAWAAITDSPAHRYELVSVGVTHMGVAVARGRDGLGREAVTMEVLLGRRPPVRDSVDVANTLLERTNSTRTNRGYDPLKRSDTLVNAATRLANRMMETSTVDDSLLGGPIGQVALEADASMTKISPFIARVDDPARLGTFAPLLEIDSKQMGMAMVLHPTEGVYYVVLLVGQ